MKHATRDLCQRIVSIGSSDVDEAAFARTRQLVLDGIAVTIAGTVQESPPAILAAHARALGGNPHASVIGFGFKTDPVQAAYVNGGSMHVLDFEPMWSPANHQLSTQLPAVLALAESRDADGLNVATAMIKGIEVMGWLREASKSTHISALRFHPPGLVGPFGAAVAASHMLGLDAGQLAHALGMAGSRCGSLLANAGTGTKCTHCGLACSLGLDAAMLAALGFTANTEILEHDRGYVANFFGKDQFEFDLLSQYGPPFRVVQPGYAIKMFPSQFGTHFGITAGLDLHAKIDDPEKIRAIHITAPFMPYVDRAKPDIGLDGKFSFQYTTVCAMLDGEIKMDTFEDEHRFNPRIERALDKVTLRMDKDIPAIFEEMWVEVEVELDDGSVLTERCNGPKGKWGTPPIEPEAHLAKVRDCLDLKLSEPDRERLIELCLNLDQLTATNVREMMAIARCDES